MFWLNNIIKLDNEFKRIKKLRWVKSVTKGSAGVGMTFEYLIGKEFDNKGLPDYDGIELKARRCYTKSLVNLFNANPNSKEKVSKYLVNNYGYPDYMYKSCNVLSAEVDTLEKRKAGINYSFILKVFRKSKRISLWIYGKDGYIVDGTTVYWTFEYLKNKLESKLKLLAVAVASRKFIDDIEYFHYFTISYYQLKNFNFFIDLIERGIISICIKISVYRRGDKIGTMDDKGISFRIKYEDLDKLFTRIRIEKDT